MHIRSVGNYIPAYGRKGGTERRGEKEEGRERREGRDGETKGREEGIGRRRV